MTGWVLIPLPTPRFPQRSIEFEIAHHLVLISNLPESEQVQGNAGRGVEEARRAGGKGGRGLVASGCETRGGDLVLSPCFFSGLLCRPGGRKRRGNPTGGGTRPRRGEKRTPRGARFPPGPEGLLGPPPLYVPSAGRITRVTLAGEGARRPCPAALAGRLVLCFDTCANCPILLSLIYRPIKSSAFLKSPCYFPPHLPPCKEEGVG